MRYRRGLIYLGGVGVTLLLLVTAALLLLPQTITWEVNDWFKEQGLVSQIETIDIDLTDGQLTVQGLTVSDATGDKRLEIGRLFVQASVGDLLNNTLTLENVELSGLYVDVEQHPEGELKFAGIGAGTQPDSEEDNSSESVGEVNATEDPPWRLILDKLALDDVEICYRIREDEASPVFHDCIIFDAFNWNGRADYTFYPDTHRALSELSASFDSSIEGFSLNDHRLNTTVMQFGALQFEGVDVKGINEAQIEKISLDQYQALQQLDSEKSENPAEYLLSSKQLTLESLTLRDQTTLVIDGIAVSGLKAAIRVNPEGELEFQKLIEAYSIPVDASAEVESPDTQDGSTFVFQLGEMNIDGDSAVSIRDESVKPVFSNSLDEIQFSAKTVDTSNPSSETEMYLSMTVGEYGKVETEGKAQLFAEKTTLDLKTTVVSVNMGDFDAYAHQLILHRIKSGNLDADVELKVVDGNLDSQAKVKLHKFYVESLGEKESNQYKEHIGIPLSLALSLLREKNDSISIEMNITGDLENPDFSLQDIIRKVSALAIRETIISYYTPFGLVKLLTAGYDLATALRFDPVQFDAGNTVLDQQDEERLDKLAKMLGQRPGVDLAICGYATQQDLEVIFPEDAARLRQLIKKNQKDKETSGEPGVEMAVSNTVSIPDAVIKRLDDIAGKRGQVVKHYLVDQHKVEASRLILCNPSFNFEDDGAARTEIAI